MTVIGDGFAPSPKVNVSGAGVSVTSVKAGFRTRTQSLNRRRSRGGDRCPLRHRDEHRDGVTRSNGSTSRRRSPCRCRGMMSAVPWTPPTECDRCEHPISAHVLGSRMRSDRWMHCTRLHHVLAPLAEALRRSGDGGRVAQIRRSRAASFCAEDPTGEGRSQRASGAERGHHKSFPLPGDMGRRDPVRMLVIDAAQRDRVSSNRLVARSARRYTRLHGTSASDGDRGTARPPVTIVLEGPPSRPRRPAAPCEGRSRARA
jgi:hypothetical protein